jgi:hypothetical protein
MLPDVSPALPVTPRAVFLRVSQPPLMPPLRRAPRMLPAFPSYLATPPSATAYTYAEFVLWVARQTVEGICTMNARSTKVVRCVIYTRVSTDQGLEQDFNSLDSQYDASQAYSRSQAHAGWSLLRAKYDDGGFSGGNTDRPALQRLLEDAYTFRKSPVAYDCVVVDASQIEPVSARKIPVRRPKTGKPPI